jgi:hypothetical protein
VTRVLARTTRRRVLALVATVLVLQAGLSVVVPGAANAERPGVSVSADRGGQVTAWGSDAQGQTDVPASLAGKTVTAVSAGQYFSLALTSDGQVTYWGANPLGPPAVPASLTGKTVTAIAAGPTHSLALTADGQVTAWGDNRRGQTNVPNSLTGRTVTAIAAGSALSMALTADGQVTSWGEGFPDVPASLAGKTVTAMAAGGSFELALTSDGQVTAWGDMVSNGTTVPAWVPASLAGQTVTAISAGGRHALALTSDGQITSWGFDGFGQSYESSSLVGKTVTAIAAGTTQSLALTSDGHVLAWRADNFVQTDTPASLAGKTVTALAAGDSHSLVITAALATVQAPTITGTPAVGQILTALPGTDNASPDDYAYQWLRDGATIAGATGPDYQVVATDLDAELSVAVTATKAGYDPVTATSDTVDPVALGNFTSPPAPTITGTVQVGQTLTAKPGTSVPAADDYAYQWLRDGVPIAGATDATYTLTGEDRHTRVSVSVTGARLGYHPVTATSTLTQPVASAAAPTLTLTATPSQLALGGQLTLAYTTSSDTDSLILRGPDLRGGTDNAVSLPTTPSGSYQLTATGVGVRTYVLVASNDAGTTTAQVTIRVVCPPRPLVVRAPASATRGSKLDVRVAKIDPDENVQVWLGHQVVAGGRADHHGRLTMHIIIPDSSALGRTLLTVTSRDRTGHTTIDIRTARHRRHHPNAWLRRSPRGSTPWLLPA